MKNTRHFILLAIIFALQQEAVFSWTLKTVETSNALGTNGNCILVVERDVIETVQVDECGGFAASVTLNNEFRAKCVDRGDKCYSVELSFMPDDPKSFQRGCVPFPTKTDNGDDTYSYSYQKVTHKNVAVTKPGGCTARVEISYVNATNCGCV